MRCEMDAGDGLADGDRDDLIRLGFAPSALGVVLDGDLEHVVEPLHERFVPASSVLKGSDDQLHSRLRVQIPFFVVKAECLVSCGFVGCIRNVCGIARDYWLDSLVSWRWPAKFGRPAAVC